MQDSIPAHLRHFLLDRLPFTLSSDPAVFYLTSGARDAKDRLDAQLGQHEVLLFLAGQGGSGTTALLRYLAVNSLGGRQWYRIDRTRQYDDAPSLLVSVRQTLEAHATSCQQHGGRQRLPPVIAIDHTDGQKPADLAELLQWHAVATVQGCPCILLFVGTEPLACCRAATPKSFTDRNVAEVELQPLTSADTGALINHRLRYAGHQGTPLFTSEAVEQIHTLSDALPRDMLHLADIALYFGQHLGLTTINGACMGKVAKCVPNAKPLPASPISLSRKRADTPTLPQSNRRAFHWPVLALVLLIGTGTTQWLLRDVPEPTIATVSETTRPSLPPQPQSLQEPQPHTLSSQAASQPYAASSASPGAQDEVAALITKAGTKFTRYLVHDPAIKQLQQPENLPASAPPPAKAAQTITELLRAVTAGDRDEVQRLLRAGLPIDSRNDFGDTPLLTAVWHSRKEVVDDLLKYSPAINYRNKDGCTALFFAAIRGHAAIAATLLDHGARIDLADRDGRTPLMAAAWNGHTEIVHLLLTHKADPNRASHEGWTALMFAALNGHTKIGMALLAYGANPNATNRDALNSRQLAAKHGHTDFFSLLP
ncbi:MAG: ankyrin repeat domain-containing protein [Desulfobulbus sp.]|jgi:ankyrin repeat protein/type II secretory pathway predicted ATPase ExeA|uniref:ankyrin repeat domain-containing protein n=1 Tax=Desulfobulbus sp. TaxID=895 RepID=UPI0028463FFF|nr:ankyrin repeat domain-containing protein [Desulfobulbus sp.]MDR2551067.1 ankyrin repeat domain-containing protein [Desulfobulbus sp.]